MDLREARRLALSLVETAPPVMVGLEEASGRVLAEDIEAPFHLPPEERSRFDGYALRSADAMGAASDRPVFIRRIAGAAAAGRVPDIEVGQGACLRILTGSPIPRGADVVLPQEAVIEEPGRIGVPRPVTPGEGIIEAGADLRRGELLLARGSILTPTRLAAVAALGAAGVRVRRRPRVAVLATGDEVRELGESLGATATSCNNRLLLAWLVRANGGVPLVAGIARDAPEEIAAKLMVSGADFIVSTGGIGRGDRDFILDAWERLGVSTHFRELNLIPGKNSAMGTQGGQIFFGFPGNPWAAQVLFEELVVPCMRMRLGTESPAKPFVRATLGARWTGKKGGLFQAVRGRIDLEAKPPVFFPTTPGDGPFLRVLASSFGYLLAPPGVSGLEAGTQVEVRLHDLSIDASAVLAPGRAETDPRPME